MIDWTKPLTLCWCGFEFHSTNYAQPYHNTLAAKINDLHLRTHQAEARIAAINKRRENIQRFIDSIPEIGHAPNIIAGPHDH